MTRVALDLTIYPLDMVQRGITAYRSIATIAVRCVRGDTATLSLTAFGDYDRTQVVDEFLNYLIALIVKNSQGL
jgi:hypothetical protein